MLVLVRQLFRFDQSALEQACDDEETSEGVEDVDALGAEGLAKLKRKTIVDAMDDEVHNPDRGVETPSRSLVFRDGVAEELDVQLNDALLCACCLVDAFGVHRNACIELLHGG